MLMKSSLVSCLPVSDRHAQLSGFVYTIRLAINGQDFGMMDQSVDNRDDTGDVGEHLSPFAKGAVGRTGSRA